MTFFRWVMVVALVLACLLGVASTVLRRVERKELADMVGVGLVLALAVAVGALILS